MFSKILTLALVVAYAQAVPIEYGHASSYASVTRFDNKQVQNLIQATLPVAVHAQIHAPVLAHPVQHSVEYHAPAKYQFKYGVQDSHTGDIKQQEESRDGDVVKGSYSLHEPDGTILTVHYTADKHSGFNAVVQREGHAAHPQQHAVVLPVHH